MKNPVLDDLEEVPERKGLEKVLFILLGLFMLSIIIIYFLPGDVFSILQGRIDSSKLKGFTAEYDSGKVVFSEEVYSELKQLWLDNQETEIKMCLTGEKVGDDYFIDDLELPKTYYKTVVSVTAEDCSAETLIPMHTHPFRHCLFSEADIKSYEAFKARNPDAMIGLMCEVDRFGFYRK